MKVAGWISTRLLVLVVVLAACGGGESSSPGAPGPATAAPVPTVSSGGNIIKQYNAPPAQTIDVDKSYTARLKTNRGTIEIDLFPKEAPVTVNNFIFLAGDGYYDEVTFHRVIKDFMIQSGDPTATGTGGPGYQFRDEFVASLVFDRPGLLAMANGGPNTNGGQFFITLVPTPWLNGRHTIFGQVVSGQEVVDEIGLVATGPRDKPLEPVIIESIEITVQ